jgi:tetratricopeptide (TPR) repeat protein
MAYPTHLPSTAWRIILAGACVVGILQSVKLAAGDVMFRRDTESSIRSAIGLVPDAPKYYMRLAQLDENDSQRMLEAALRLNPYNAQGTIELALRYEAEGDYSRAENMFLQAFVVDKTYLPRWSLANFYLRRNDLPAFWMWVRKAAEMPADDIGSLFELCWRVSPDPD